ncbi:DUF2188 domain-containing protein [Pararhizobium antarcticum]|uniref:DUF2188 domain-containing protein n=1 Tax=Pararhizobium antarcticum TaxID=1798805 RepID=UPI000A538705|nr:DUF2188 domain-containing protein [Pararhizobium antarcticum]
MTVDGINFEHSIEVTRLNSGKWTYVIRLREEKSRPSMRFRTREQAVDEARELLSYML